MRRAFLSRELDGTGEARAAILAELRIVLRGA